MADLFDDGTDLDAVMRAAAEMFHNVNPLAQQMHVCPECGVPNDPPVRREVEGCRTTLSCVACGYTFVRWPTAGLAP